MNHEFYNNSDHQHIFGVFDGHGMQGHEVSNYCAKVLVSELEQ